jgi:tripartite-type tricarboxylate transporter receptor subunit TctC
MRQAMKKILLILATLLCTVVHAQGQPYPNKPIRFIVPFPPGGNLDFIARIVAPKLAESLGQTVVIENKGGAGGIVGAEYASKQPNDGYTIFLGNTGTLGIYPGTYASLPYDPVKDFVGVGMTSTNVMLAVMHPDVPATSVKEFVSYAKANPGKIAAALAGSGSMPHFATEQLKSSAGIDFLMVPYKGGGPAVTDLVGGQVQLLFEAPTVSISFVKAGRLKALAVTGKERLAALPDVPTFAESGFPGVDAVAWQGVVVPTGTPPAIIAKLSEALAKAITSTEVREKFAAQGLDAASSTAEEFTAHIRSEVPKWARIAKSANIKAD